MKQATLPIIEETIRRADELAAAIKRAENKQPYYVLRAMSKYQQARQALREGRKLPE